MTNNCADASFLAMWKKEFGEMRPEEVARAEAIRLLDFYEGTPLTEPPAPTPNADVDSPSAGDTNASARDPQSANCEHRTGS
jgi:hypothetical protein